MPTLPIFRDGRPFSISPSYSMPIVAVGWSMAPTLTTQLVLDALNIAVVTRRPKGVIHHSDQSSLRTSIEFGHPQACVPRRVRPA